MYRMLHYMSKKYLNLGNGLSSVVVECLQKYWSEWGSKIWLFKQRVVRTILNVYVFRPFGFIASKTLKLFGFPIF